MKNKKYHQVQKKYNKFFKEQYNTGGLERTPYGETKDSLAYKKYKVLPNKSKISKLSKKLYLKKDSVLTSITAFMEGYNQRSIQPYSTNPSLFVQAKLGKDKLVITQYSPHSNTDSITVIHNPGTIIQYYHKNFTINGKHSPEYSSTFVQYENVSEEQQFQYSCTLKYYHITKTIHDIMSTLSEAKENNKLNLALIYSTVLKANQEYS